MGLTYLCPPFLSSVHKTEAEVQEMLARREEKLRLKAERRRKQEADVDRKQQQREENRWGGTLGREQE